MGLAWSGARFVLSAMDMGMKLDSVCTLGRLAARPAAAMSGDGTRCIVQRLSLVVRQVASQKATDSFTRRNVH
jgi:hypothetical protein